MGQPCKAPGGGVGGRCRNHGGAILGAPLGRPNKGPKTGRRLVLFSASTGVLDDVCAPPRERRRWGMWALPLDLFERLPSDCLADLVEVGYMSFQLDLGGVRRPIARNWPQLLNYRIVRLLTERGRIAFAIMTTRRDIERALRQRVGERNTEPHRVEPGELLAALQASGGRMPRRSDRRISP